MATEDQQHRVPHLENPFEQKATDGEVSMNDDNEITLSQFEQQSSSKKSKKSKQKEELSSSKRNNQLQISEPDHSAASMRKNDAIDDSLPIFSSARQDADSLNDELKEDDDDEKNNENGASSAEDELNYVATDDANDGMDSNASNAGSDAENKVEEAEGNETKGFEGVQRLKAQLMAAEEEGARINPSADSAVSAQAQHNRLVLDEEQVQDALIQAAEDAMRYAYEESSRRHQQSEDGQYTTFEQHQLAEILVRQKQGLLRLEDLDHRMESMESHLSKVTSLVQQQRTALNANRSFSATRESPDARPSSSTVENGTMQQPSVQMMLSNGQTEGEEVTRDTEPSSSQRYYPYTSPSSLLPGNNNFRSRFIELFENIRMRILSMVDSTNRFVLNKAGVESWEAARGRIQQVRRELVSRMIARIRHARSFLAGRLNELTGGGEDSFRGVLEGFEDRVLATALVSAIATLALLYRYRRRQHQREAALLEVIPGGLLPPLSNPERSRVTTTLIIT